MRSIFLATTRNRFGVFEYVKVLFLFFLMPACFASSIPASQDTTGKPAKEEIIQKTRTLRMPFIANNGQVDERVSFYARTFGGTAFVTKDGEIVYALPKSGDVEDGETHRKAAKCAKERSEKHISHKDTKNTEEKIEGGMDFVVSAQSNDKHCLSVLPATTGHAGSDCPPLAGVDGVDGVDGNFDGFASPIRQSQDRLNPSLYILVLDPGGFRFAT